MIRTDYDELIAALDHYRDVQATRERDLSAPGHYDPCDTQKEHYEAEVLKAERRLDDIFEKLVTGHQRGCACPHQPLG